MSKLSFNADGSVNYSKKNSRNTKIYEHMAEPPATTATPPVAQLPADIVRVNGWSNTNPFDSQPERNQTAENCRQKALNSGGKYVAWGHRNENHPNENLRNTCFLYKEGFTTYAGNAGDAAHQTGCLRPGEKLEWGCKTTPPPATVQIPTQPILVPDRLISPGCLTDNSLMSPNGYRVTFTANGNLIIYDPKGELVWSTNTGSNDNMYARLCMQADGNLVAYRTNGTPYWSSQTPIGGARGPYRATIQNDGNFVIYDNANQPIWSTKTNVTTAPAVVPDIVDDWSGAGPNVTYTYSPGNVTVVNRQKFSFIVESINGDPMISMYNRGPYDPNLYRYIHIKYKVLPTANPAQQTYPNLCEVFFTSADTNNTAKGGYSSKKKYVDTQVGVWNDLVLDMTKSDNDMNIDNNLWRLKPITGFRFDFTANPNVRMELSYFILSQSKQIPIINNYYLSEGTSIKCNNDANPAAVYRYSADNTRKGYPSPQIAASWNSGWNVNLNSINCANIPNTGNIGWKPEQVSKTLYQVGDRIGINNTNPNAMGVVDVNGNVVTNAVLISSNINHLDTAGFDGAIYRADGQLQISSDDLIRFRNTGAKQTGIQFDTRDVKSSIQGPSRELKLNPSGIILGGQNAGKEFNSAQISAGIHIPNSLNIVGMSSDTNWVNRRIDMWHEGGLNLYGNVQLRQSGDNAGTGQTLELGRNANSNYILSKNKNLNINTSGANTSVCLYDTCYNNDEFKKLKQDYLKATKNAEGADTLCLGDVCYTNTELQKLRLNLVSRSGGAGLIKVAVTEFIPNRDNLLDAASGYAGTNPMYIDVNSFSDNMDVFNLVFKNVLPNRTFKLHIYFNILIDETKAALVPNGVEYNTIIKAGTLVPIFEYDLDSYLADSTAGNASITPVSGVGATSGDRTTTTFRIPNKSVSGIIKCKLTYRHQTGNNVFMIANLKSAVEKLGQLF